MSIYFTKEHEWVKIKEGIAAVGISEHAAHELGDITFVELPAMGKVVEVNEALNDAPEIVNESAEDAGWLAWVEIADEAELKSLMTREQYDEYLKTV